MRNLKLGDGDDLKSGEMRFEIRGKSYEGIKNGRMVPGEWKQLPLTVEETKKLMSGFTGDSMAKKISAMKVKPVVRSISLIQKNFAVVHQECEDIMRRDNNTLIRFPSRKPNGKKGIIMKDVDEIRTGVLYYRSLKTFQYCNQNIMVRSQYLQSALDTLVRDKGLENCSNLSDIVCGDRSILDPLNETDCLRLLEDIPRYTSGMMKDEFGKRIAMRKRYKSGLKKIMETLRVRMEEEPVLICPQWIDGFSGWKLIFGGMNASEDEYKKLCSSGRLATVNIKEGSGKHLVQSLQQRDYMLTQLRYYDVFAKHLVIKSGVDVSDGQNSEFKCCTLITGNSAVDVCKSIGGSSLDVVRLAMKKREAEGLPLASSFLFRKCVAGCGICWDAADSKESLDARRAELARNLTPSAATAKLILSHVDSEVQAYKKTTATRKYRSVLKLRPGGKANPKQHEQYLIMGHQRKGVPDDMKNSYKKGVHRADGKSDLSAQDLMENFLLELKEVNLLTLLAEMKFLKRCDGDCDLNCADYIGVQWYGSAKD